MTRIERFNHDRPITFRLTVISMIFGSLFCTIFAVGRAVEAGGPARVVQAAFQIPEAPADAPEPGPAPDPNNLPMSLEISGPQKVVIGELVTLELVETNPEVVRERSWNFDPPIGTVLYNPDRTRAYFTTSEPGEFTFDVLSIHKVYGSVRARFKLQMLDRPGLVARAALGAAPAMAATAPAEGDGDDPADVIRQAAAAVESVTPAEVAEVRSAMTRAINGAELKPPILSPYNVLSESKAMAMIALRRFAKGPDRWAPFFEKVEGIFGELEEAGEFKDPKQRVEAMKSTAAALGGK